MATCWDQLEPGTVDIWQLSTAFMKRESAMQILAIEEQKRALRFLRSEDGVRFAASRAALRLLLGRYLDRDPASIEFAYSDHGKAITKDTDVGVDIEEINANVDIHEVAAMVFSQKESAHFFSLSIDAQRTFFFEVWTIKEAFLKAEGSGLAISPSSIEAQELPVSKITVTAGFASAVACLPDAPTQIKQLAFTWGF
jgi:4'-phosphopantetheinyl transferase